MIDNKFDGNYVPSISGVSDLDDQTPVPIAADPTTRHLKVDANIENTSANPVPTSEVSPTSFEGGQVTVGLTEVEITFTGTTKAISIESDVSNTGMVYIGKTGVTTSTGMVQLEPGSSVSLELNDSDNAIYAISDTAGQIVRKLALL